MLFFLFRAKIISKIFKCFTNNNNNLLVRELPGEYLLVNFVIDFIKLSNWFYVVFSFCIFESKAPSSFVRLDFCPSIDSKIKEKKNIILHRKSWTIAKCQYIGIHSSIFVAVKLFIDILLVDAMWCLLPKICLRFIFFTFFSID